MTQTKLINCTLSSLIGKDVKGIKAQVTNPRYLSNEVPEKWRTLTGIRTFKEKGKDWVELTWIKDVSDSCNFTGCTLESDACMIQITPEELNKMNCRNKVFQKNAEDWKQMIALLDSGEMVKVSEEIAEYFLNVLPPLGGWSRFACSEPVYHNNNGEPVYNCFVGIAGKFYAKQLTYPELKAWKPLGV